MKKITLKIDGMMCGMCEKRVEKAIKDNFSVKNISVSSEEGKAEFYSKKDVDLNKLSSVIFSAGYEVKDSQISE